MSSNTTKREHLASLAGNIAESMGVGVASVAAPEGATLPGAKGRMDGVARSRNVAEIPVEKIGPDRTIVSLKRGSLAYPDESATLLVVTPTLTGDDGPPVVLSGPGLAAGSGLPAEDRAPPVGRHQSLHRL